MKKIRTRLSIMKGIVKDGSCMKGNLVYVVIRESMLTDKTWIVDIFAKKKDADLCTENLKNNVEHFSYKDNEGNPIPRYNYYVDTFVIQ